MRLWLIEGLVIAAASLAAGIAIAYWILDALTLIAPSKLPRLDQVALSSPAIATSAIGPRALAGTVAA